MAPTSEPELLVLHALRLKSFAATEVVAETAGLAVEATRELLERYRDEERVRYREGALTGWMLLPAGRAEGARLLAAELDASGLETRREIDAAYRQFLTLNQPLLQVCTDWQLRPSPAAAPGAEPVINDHEDAAYDTNVIGVLRSLDADAQPVCASLAESLERFSRYGARLATALGRIEGGEIDYFTKPMIDSYHTVWFELHEDLLATLGIERGSEEGV